MGVACCGARSKPYKTDMISNRSIQMQNQTPINHHGINTTACGYGFELNSHELGTMMAHQRELKIREEQNDLYEQFEEVYFKVRKFYKEHNIDSCMPLVGQLEETIAKIDYRYLDISAEEQKQISSFIKNIKDRYFDMLKFAKHLDPDGWVDQGDKNGVRMFSKRQNGTVGMLMETQINVPVQIFLTVMAQMQFYDQLIPSANNSREDKYIDRNHKIGYCIFDLPILSMRQSIFQGVGYNRLNHNDTIFMYSQSVHDKPQLCQKYDFEPKLNKEYVQIIFEYLCVQYTPTGVGKGKATVAINIDMKLNFVPLALMEMVCKKFCSDFMWVVMQASNKFPGSKWQDKIKRHPQTFNFFKETINNYYQDKRLT